MSPTIANPYSDEFFVKDSSVTIWRQGGLAGQSDEQTAVPIMVVSVFMALGVNERFEELATG